MSGMRSAKAQCLSMFTKHQNFRCLKISDWMQTDEFRKEVLKAFRFRMMHQNDFENAFTPVYDDSQRAARELREKGAKDSYVTSNITGGDNTAKDRKMEKNPSKIVRSERRAQPRNKENQKIFKLGVGHQLN